MTIWHRKGINGMKEKQKQLTLAREFVSTNEYLQQKKDLVLLTLQGSRGYGVHSNTSDFDIKGVYMEPIEELLGYGGITESDMDTDNDTSLYSFRRAIELLCKGNPSMLNIIGCKPIESLYATEVGKQLVETREMFYTTKCIQTFGGYATRQLNQLESFLTYDLDTQKLQRRVERSLRQAVSHFNETYPNVGELGVKNENGVLIVDFKGLVCPLEEIKGVLSEIRNIHQQYLQLGKLTGRNNRPTPQKIDKHASHLVLLYVQLIDILEGKGLVTYMGGRIPELLRIKEGYYRNVDNTYKPAFFELVEKYQEKVDELAKTTTLPPYVDSVKVQEFVYECTCKHHKVRG